MPEKRGKKTGKMNLNKCEFSKVELETPREKQNTRPCHYKKTVLYQDHTIGISEQMKKKIRVYHHINIQIKTE